MLSGKKQAIVPKTAAVVRCDQRQWITPLAISEGKCWGITHYWLCLNAILTNKFKDYNDIKERAGSLITAVSANMGDVLLLSQGLNPDSAQPIFIHKLEITTLKQMGVDAAICPATFKMHSTNDTEICAESVVRHLQSLLRSSEKMYMNFGFMFQDKKVGHCVGIIKNPTKDCAVLFFDCNTGVGFFNEADDFYQFFKEYIKRHMQISLKPIIKTVGYLLQSYNCNLTLAGKPMLMRAAPKSAAALMDAKSNAASKDYFLINIR